MELDIILSEALENISKAKTLEDLNLTRIRFLNKKSRINLMMLEMKKLELEERAAFGKQINEVKSQINEAIDKKIKELANKEIKEKMEKESIDLSLNGSATPLGAKNPLFKVTDEIVEIFKDMGFIIADGPEVETDHFNFELLNIPKDHPARDMQDTFYINENLLLRTHTSSIQAHEMLKKEGKPMMLICPGKTYRRDDDDATHSHQFAQIEGLVIGENITLANLKATLELFIKKMYGEKRKIRLRPSFFPFTEPSCEVDISCSECNGKGCLMCKNSGYIEILGAGMVHPNVLKMCGYDTTKYSGFAFGVGIERVAMLKYGINDIRKFYQNDIRFLKQFTRRK